MTTCRSRRRFLAAAAAGGALLFGGPAAAFRVEEMDAAAADAFARACGGDDHGLSARLMAAANAALPEGRRLSAKALDELLRRTACPVCGCMIGPVAESDVGG